jgi:hypothetical protein
VVCLAPRALEEIVRPRRLSGVVVRPLNFTVRARCELSLGFQLCQRHVAADVNHSPAIREPSGASSFAP